MSFFIPTSTEAILEVKVRPQESTVNDSVAEGLLNLKLKQYLTEQSFSEQQDYVSLAATAAYVSLNKLDQRRRYRASINLLPSIGNNFNFSQGSSSSGLGYALAIFDSWWRLVLNKSTSFKYPIFASGEVLTSGQIKPIGHLADKIDAVCRYAEDDGNSICHFYFCYPSANTCDMSDAQRTRLTNLGATIISADRLQTLFGELLGSDYDGDPLGRWQPFRGLKSFNYEDSVRFFGRDNEVAKLQSNIHENHGLLLISGASGVGKSSLVKAGLIPALERDNGKLHWKTINMDELGPYDKMLRFMIEEMNRAWGLEGRGATVESLMFAFSRSVADGIELLISHIPDQPIRCLLFLDQFEDMFKHADHTESIISEVLTLIDSLARGIQSLCIVIAIRDDYLKLALSFKVLSPLVVTSIHSQLSTAAWRSIIVDQSAFSGLSFETDTEGTSLAQIIIDEAATTPSALPMVEFLLEYLHQKATEEGANSNLLRLENYNAIGGLHGAIAYRAREIVEDFGHPSVLKYLFDLFVGLDGHSLPYAKRVSRKEVKDTSKYLSQLVNELIEGNLVEVSASSDNDSWVTLSHDCLFEHWVDLNSWIEISEDYLLWRTKIDPKFIIWKSLVRESEARTYQQLTPISSFREGLEKFKKDNLISKYDTTPLELVNEGVTYCRQKRIADKYLYRYVMDSQYRIMMYFILVVAIVLVTFVV